MLLFATALALVYYRMCSTDVYRSKQTGSSTKGNHHPSFLRFWNWAEEKLSMQPKFVAAQKMLLNRTQQTFVNGLLGFITLGIYIPLEARVYCLYNNCMSCPSIRATLSAPLWLNILLVLPIVFA